MIDGRLLLCSQEPKEVKRAWFKEHETYKKMTPEKLQKGNNISCWLPVVVEMFHDGREAGASTLQ